MRSLKPVLALALPCLILAACDIPTDLPILEQRWIVPVEETTLGVDELLPAGVAVSGSNFSVSVDALTTGESLGSLCASCIESGGVPVPVPAFSGSFSSSTALPSNVSGAVISSGSVQVAIQNGFAFDPVAGGGTLTVTLRDGPGGRQLGQTVIDGASQAMAPGSTTSRTIALASGAVGTAIHASAALSSPGGEVAPMTLSDRISVTATTTSLLVSSATVNVSGTSVTFDPVNLDVEGVQGSVTRNIQQGALTLDVVNPFGVSVAGNLVIGPVSKSFSLPASGTSKVTLSYTGDELRSFLGKSNIQFSGSGTASGGNVTVSPAQQMIIEATLDITLKIG